MKKILIVDDDKDLLFSLASIFSKRMYDTLAIADAGQAIDAAAVFQPDIILLDLNLDPYDGKDICKTLKENISTSKIPVMMMSAQISKAEIKKFCDPDDFIEKPFAPKALFKKIEALVS